MSGSLPHFSVFACSVRGLLPRALKVAALRATLCLAFLALLSPTQMWAQGTSVLTLLSTDGRELEMGDEVRGALSASDFLTAGNSYVEAWALEGRPGQEVSIDLISNDFDSYLYVFGPGLGETLTDDDGGGACHARVNFTMLDRGVFHVVASSTNWRQAGTYQLRVSEAPSPVMERTCGGIDGSELAALSTEGRQLTWGEPVWGRLVGNESTIRDGQPIQAWALEAIAGETATVRLRSDDFDAYLFAFGPGMNEAMSDDDSGGGLDSELTIWFPETGTYTIGASALSSGSTGSYSLTVTEPMDRIEMIDLSTAGRLLRIGSSARGMLTEADPVIDGQPVQAWAFEALAGDFATIELMSGDFDSYLFLVGPGLPEPLSDDDGGEGLNSRLEVSFPADGVYRVVASSLGGATGAFTLSVR